MEQITRCAADLPYLEMLRPFPAFGGLDLASVSDLTAFVMAWSVADRLYLYPWIFLPGDNLADRSKRDSVPYVQWVEQGYLELTPGNTTDWRYVTGRIKQLARVFDIRELGFDRHGARDTVADLMDDGIAVMDIGQGMVSMTAPTKRFEEMVLSKRLIHTGHPILRWNVDCTTVKQDEAGNIKPVKPDRLKSRKRIDGVVAAIMAVDCAMRNQEIEAGVL